MKKTVSIIIIIFSVLTLRVEAAENMLYGDVDDMMEEAGIGDLYESTPENTKELLEKMGFDELTLEKVLSLSPKVFFSLCLEILKEQLTKPIVTLAAIIGISVLCAFLNGMKDSALSGSLSPVFNSVAVLCVITAVASPVLDSIGRTSQTVRDMSNFMLGFVPVFTGVVTAAAQPATAITYNAFLFASSQLIGRVIVNNVLPLTCIYLAFCLVGSAVPALNLSTAAGTIKSAASWVLGLLTTLFVGLLTMQTIVSSSADTMIAKSAKFVIGGFVPVIGGAISDALLAAQGYLRMIKTVVGAFGIVVALLTFLPALMSVTVWYITVSVGASVSGLLGVKEISSVLKAITNTLQMLLAVIICFGLLIIVSATIVMMVGTGA